MDQGLVTKIVEEIKADLAAGHISEADATMAWLLPRLSLSEQREAEAWYIEKRRAAMPTPPAISSPWATAQLPGAAGVGPLQSWGSPLSTVQSPPLATDVVQAAPINVRVVRDPVAPERDVFQTRSGWGVFIWPLFWTAVGPFLGFIPWVISLPWLIVVCLRWLNTEYVITTRALRVHEGIFGRKDTELLLSKIESVHVSQGFLGRMLGYSSVVVTGTGRMVERFGSVSDAAGLRDALMEQIAERER